MSDTRKPSGDHASYRRGDLRPFDLLRHPVWVFDIAGRSMWWANQEALILWGARDLDALLEQDFSADMSDVTAARLDGYLERFAQGEVVAEQWTFYPHGSPVTVQCTCSGIEIRPDEEPPRLAMLVEARWGREKMAERDALRGVEALRYTPMMVTLFALDGFVLFQNPAAAQAFGPGKAGVHGFVSRFAEPALGERLWESACAGVVVHEEAAFATRQGERWHEIHCRTTEDPGTGLLALLVNQQDVTEKRDAERRYRELFSGSRVPMLLIDPADGAIVDANGAAAAFYGYKRAQLRAMRIMDINVLSNPQVRAEMERARRGKRHHFLFRHRLASGEVRDVEVHSGPLCLGERELLYSIVHDITERTIAERALQESERKYRSLIDNTPAGFWMIDGSRRTVQVNRALCRMLGRTEAQMLGRTPLEFVDEENAAVFRRQMARIPETSHRRYEITLLHKDGHPVPTLFNATTLWDERGEVAGSFAFVSDLTELKSAEATLRKLSSAVEHTTSSVIITDVQGVIEYVNPHFTRVTGYAATEAVGARPSILKSGMNPPSIYRELWSSIRAGEPWRGELHNRRKDGGHYWSLLTISPIRNGEGRITHFVGVGEDVTELKEAHARAERMSLYDSLTGLANRRLFTDRLVQAVREARRNDTAAALFYLDLDRFKQVNDSLGHDIGDRLLVEVAERLRASVRELDTVARLGGDEFSVLLPGIGDTRGARTVALKILERLGRPVDLPGLHTPVTSSIGITLIPADSLDADVLMRNADMAMYAAKAKGRNTYQFFTESMNREVSRRLAVERELRRAIDAEQLELHYQPVVDLATSRVVGAEALLRWRRPGHGLMEPGQFIPVAEETDLILQLGEWVLQTACREMCRKGPDSGPRWVSINVSARQLLRPGFVGQVERILQQEGLPVGTLRLELTEGVLIRQSEETIATLGRLRQLGLGITLDDFGTGYASLSCLKRFPVDALKIDRSFVGGIPTDPNETAITAAIIAMAHKLGIEVIAEGIEHEAQREFLLDNACRYGQGFLFGRPVRFCAFSRTGG